MPRATVARSERSRPGWRGLRPSSRRVTWGPPHLGRTRRCVPDGRSVGPLGDAGRRHGLQQFDAEPLGIDRWSSAASGFRSHGCSNKRAPAALKVGSVQAVSSTGAPMLLAVGGIGDIHRAADRGSLPSAPGLRSPDQATSKIFSCVWPPASTQPLITWTRYRDWPRPGPWPLWITSVALLARDAHPTGRRPSARHGHSLRNRRSRSSSVVALP